MTSMICKTSLFRMIAAGREVLDEAPHVALVPAAVMFLTVLSFVSPQVFFLVIAGAAVVTLAAVALFLDEPEGHMAEVLPDGTVQMIEVT